MNSELDASPTKITHMDPEHELRKTMFLYQVSRRVHADPTGDHPTLVHRAASAPAMHKGSCPEDRRPGVNGRPDTENSSDAAAGRRDGCHDPQIGVRQKGAALYIPSRSVTPARCDYWSHLGIHIGIYKREETSQAIFPPGRSSPHPWASTWSYQVVRTAVFSF